MTNRPSRSHQNTHGKHSRRLPFGTQQKVMSCDDGVKETRQLYVRNTNCCSVLKTEAFIACRFDKKTLLFIIVAAVCLLERVVDRRASF